MATEADDIAIYRQRWAKKPRKGAKAHTWKLPPLPSFPTAGMSLSDFIIFKVRVARDSKGKKVAYFFQMYGLPLPESPHLDLRIKEIRVKRGNFGFVHFLTVAGWLVYNSRGELFVKQASPELTKEWFYGTGGRSIDTNGNLRNEKGQCCNCAKQGSC